MKEFKVYNFVSGCEGIANDERADQFVFYNFTGPNRVYHKSQWTRTTQHIPLPKTEPEFKEFTICNRKTDKYALANDYIDGEYIFVRKFLPNLYYPWSDWTRVGSPLKQENRLKVGDRVIVVGNGYLKGVLLNIFSIEDDYCRVCRNPTPCLANTPVRESDLMWIHKNRLELFKEQQETVKFSIGDKVVFNWKVVNILDIDDVNRLVKIPVPVYTDGKVTGRGNMWVAVNRIRPYVGLRHNFKIVNINTFEEADADSWNSTGFFLFIKNPSGDFDNRFYDFSDGWRVASSLKVGDKVRIVNFHPDWKAEFEDEEAIFTIDHMEECGDRAFLVGSESWSKKFDRSKRRFVRAPLKDLELYIAPKEVPDRSAQLKKWIEFWRIGNREFKVGDWVEIISSAIYPIGLTGKIDFVGDSTIRIDTRSPYGNLWIPMLCVKHILLRQEFEVGNHVKVIGGPNCPPGTGADIIEVDYANSAVRLQNIVHGIFWTYMKNVEHFFKPTVKQEKTMKLEVYNKYESSKEQIVRLELLKCGEEVRIICVNSSGDTLAHLLSLTKDGVKLFDHVDKSLGFPLDSKGRLLIKS